MKNLKENTSIIIKEADKGGAVVIMDKNYYKDKVLEQLNDTDYYKKEARNMDNVTLRKIKDLVTRNSNSFTAKEVDYLLNFQI